MACLPGSHAHLAPAESLQTEVSGRLAQAHALRRGLTCPIVAAEPTMGVRLAPAQMGQRSLVPEQFCQPRHLLRVAGVSPHVPQQTEGPAMAFKSPYALAPVGRDGLRISQAGGFPSQS